MSNKSIGKCVYCDKSLFSESIHTCAPQPKQEQGEPVAAQCKFDTEKTWGWCSIEHHNLVQSEPHKWPQYQTRLLYTTPQQHKPLTDEQILSFVNAAPALDTAEDEWLYVARAIEAAHGIKGQV